MSISTADYKQLILDELDLIEYPDSLRAVNSYWGLNSVPSERETFLKTKVDMIKWLLGKLRRKKDVTVGGKDSAKLSQEFTNTLKLLDKAEADLERQYPGTSTASEVATLESHPLISELPDSYGDYVRSSCHYD